MRKSFAFVDSVAVQSGVPWLQEKPIAVIAYTMLVMKLFMRSVHIQGVWEGYNFASCSKDSVVIQILTRQQLVVCVAFNAIQISEISRAQLQSSAKALNITTKKKEKKDLVKLVAEALGYM